MDNNQSADGLAGLVDVEHIEKVVISIQIGLGKWLFPFHSY